MNAPPRDRIAQGKALWRLRRAGFARGGGDRYRQYERGKRVARAIAVDTRDYERLVRALAAIVGV